MALLRGKTALVTGGANGLGKAFAAAFLASGASNVCLLDILPESDGPSVTSTFGKHQSQTHYFNCDVTDVERLRATYSSIQDRFGSLDIVCNNAGIGASGFDLADKIIDINLRAVIHGTQIAYELMKGQSHGGVIINTASFGGLTPMPFSPIYAATKAGVIHFSRSMSYMAARKVRVNAICPAFADTPLVQSALASPMMRAAVEMQGALMTPEFVAEALMELVTDEEKVGEVYVVTPKGKSFMKYGSNGITSKL